MFQLITSWTGPVDEFKCMSSGFILLKASTNVSF